MKPGECTRAARRGAGRRVLPVASLGAARRGAGRVSPVASLGAARRGRLPPPLLPFPRAAQSGRVAARLFFIRRVLCPIFFQLSFASVHADDGGVVQLALQRAFHRVDVFPPQAGLLGLFGLGQALGAALFCQRVDARDFFLCDGGSPLSRSMLCSSASVRPRSRAQRRPAAPRPSRGRGPCALWLYCITTARGFPSFFAVRIIFAQTRRQTPQSRDLPPRPMVLKGM